MCSVLRWLRLWRVPVARTSAAAARLLAFRLLQVENLRAVAPSLVMIDLEEVDSPFSLTGV